VKKSLLKKGVGVAAALCTGIAMMAFATPAHALVYSGSTDVVVAAGGSDTVQNFDEALLAAYDGSTTIFPSHTVHTFNIPAFPSPSYVVPGDDNCVQSVSWVQSGGTDLTGTQNAPSGSGAGKTYIAGEEAKVTGQKGCIDIGRSSSAPGAIGASEKATFEYYAFALDAVSWSSASLQAPPILTRQQVQDIYSCTTTDWSTVGGTPGPIQRYLPQSASGTRSFFLSQFGITTTMLNTTSGSCPAVKADSILNNAGGANIKMEENQCATIEAGDIAKAIMPYSAGLWSYQSANAGNPTIDVRNGCRLGAVSAPGKAAAGSCPATSAVKANPVKWVTSDRTYALDTAGEIKEENVTIANSCLSAANDFPGVRYVFNYLDNASNLLGYQAAFNMVGFANTAAPSAAKSPLCSNTGVSDDQTYALALIGSYGFAPLPTTVGAAGAAVAPGSNVAGSTCRKFVPA